MITVLMVLDAIIGLLLIGSVVMQTPKSAGMGMGGGSDTVFSSSARGLDALLATVMMPSGIPVAAVAIDGGVNAALLCAQILSVSEPVLAEALDARRRADAEKVLQKNAAAEAEFNQ